MAKKWPIHSCAKFEQFMLVFKSKGAKTEWCTQAKCVNKQASSVYLLTEILFRTKVFFTTKAFFSESLRGDAYPSGFRDGYFK